METMFLVVWLLSTVSSTIFTCRHRHELADTRGGLLLCLLACWIPILNTALCLTILILTLWDQLPSVREWLDKPFP